MNVKKENHKQRAYLNSVTSILDHGARQLTGFFVSPFIVKGLGSTFYGVYQILLELTGYANIADTRSQVLKWTIARKRNIASEEELRSEVTTGLAIMLLVLPIVLVAGGALAWYAPSIAKIDEQYHQLVRITASIMILGMISYKANDLFESILRGMNLGFKGIGVRSFIIVFSGGLKVSIILLGYGLIELAIVQVISGIFTSLAFYWIVKKNVPWFGFGETSFLKIRSYGKLSGWFFLSKIANMALLHSEKVILGFLAGPEIVTFYVLTMFTSSAMKGIVDNVISGVIPGLGSFYGKEEYQKIIDSTKLINSIIYLFTFAIGGSIILFNRSFLFLWVGSENYAGNLENLLILFLTVQYIFFYTSSVIINVTLDLKRKVFITLFASGISILLAFVLVRDYGIVGFCISFLIGRMVLSIGYPIILKRKINDNSPLIKLDNVRQSLFIVIAFGVGAYIQDYIEINSWIYLVLFGGLSCVILFLVYWIFGLRKYQRVILWDSVSKLKFFKIKE
ncbi:MATE family efflux transporter [Aquiflexum lacus]|uniref:polysaccharide biosynthesis protein n=1 Tax=Aquiflexum lacus TaxID=2483805 RepID=UPI001892D969|nr:polysaccharide biosynthesis protein [Aquiflexum lacus]